MGLGRIGIGFVKATVGDKVGHQRTGKALFEGMKLDFVKALCAGDFMRIERIPNVQYGCVSAYPERTVPKQLQ